MILNVLGKSYVILKGLEMKIREEKSRNTVGGSWGFIPLKAPKRGL